MQKLSVEQCSRARHDFFVSGVRPPNIVLSGGNTLFDGLAGRLWNELEKM